MVFPSLSEFSTFIVIQTIKGFGIVNKAEIDVFLELSSFFDDPAVPLNSRVPPFHPLKKGCHEGEMKPICHA